MKQMISKDSMMEKLTDIASFSPVRLPCHAVAMGNSLEKYREGLVIHQNQAI